MKVGEFCWLRFLGVVLLSTLLFAVGFTYRNLFYRQTNKSGYYEIDGVRPTDTVQAVVARLGKPDFDFPNVLGWDRKGIRVLYNADDVVSQVEGHTVKWGSKELSVGTAARVAKFRLDLDSDKPYRNGYIVSTQSPDSRGNYLLIAAESRKGLDVVTGVTVAAPESLVARDDRDMRKRMIDWRKKDWRKWRLGELHRVP